MTAATLAARRVRSAVQGGRALLVALALLALLINLGFAAALATGGSTDVLVARDEQSPRVTLAAPLDERRVLVGTLGNEVLRLEGGQAVGRAAFSNVVGGLAASTRGDEVYVGTSDGAVAVLDADLRPGRQLQVEGRVVGLRPAADGGFFVAHGVGAFSDRYFVSLFPPGAERPSFTRQVEFTISGLDRYRDRVAYSTTNARVGALSADDGAPLWLTMVTRPATKLAAAAATDRVIVGDDRGNVTLLDGSTGERVWEANVTGFPIRSLAFDERSGSYLVGDTNGGVYALSDVGWTLFSARASTSSVEAFLPEGGGLIGVPREGSWFAVRPAAMQAAASAERLRLVWLGVDALLVALLAAAAVAAVPRWRAGARRLGRQLRRSRLGYAFVFPSLAMIALFSYYPALMALYLSFTNFSLRTVTQFIGFENYVTVLTTDFYFRVGFGNMLLIMAASIVKVLTVPLLTAELIFWIRNHVHRYVFRTLVVFPAVVPDLVATLLWRWIWDPRVGLINQLLGTVGLASLQHPWLGDESTAIWAIIFTGFPFLGAFAFLIYMGGLLNINAELFDSAQIDGAGPWRRFWHIDLPLLEPQLRLLLFFAFAGSIQGFANILIFTRGGPGYATYVPALQMYLQIASGGDFGYASAIGTILFAVIFVGTLLIMRVGRPAASGSGV
jgi:ABC-type sugar transport system permease subunit